MTLAARIIGVTALLVIVLASAIAYVAGDLASQQVRRQIGSALGDLALQMADRLDREMHTRINEIEVLAGLTGMQRIDHPEVPRRIIDSLQDSMPVFSWVGVVDTVGLVVAGTDGVLEGISIAHRPVFLEGSKGLFVGDVHDAVMLASLLPNPTGEPIKFVDIAHPIGDETNDNRGVLAAHLSWTWARDVADGLLATSGSLERVELFVVATDATILLGPGTDGQDMLGRALVLDAAALGVAGRTGWTLEPWPDGGRYLTGYAKADGYGDFDGLGWVVLARLPVDDAYAPVDALLREIAFVGIAFAVIAGLVGYGVTSRIVTPLRALAGAADAMRRGARKGFPHVSGPREIEMLSNALEDLIESLVAKQHEVDLLNDRAYRDPLTGLANRAALERFLASRATGDGLGGDWAYAVLGIDLDGFKKVNDTHGHDAGDRLLKEVAARLRACVRSGDLLVRTGGDEFVAFLVMAHAENDGPARRIAGRIITRLSEPYDVIGAADADPDSSSGRQTARIGASIGVACFPRDGRPPETVLKLADTALYQAKSSGKGRVVVHRGPA